MRYHKCIMPSWNIHTAHAERLFADSQPESLGIEDPNAFLFGSYVPDIYLGFMVLETTFHIDYCLTHHAVPNMIPMPDADQFWDTYVSRVVSKIGSAHEGQMASVSSSQATSSSSGQATSSSSGQAASDPSEQIAAASRSLVLGAWAHLVADRFYNGHFRSFMKTHNTPMGEELRKCKQADFDLFGSSLGITSHVEATPALVRAAKRFRPYSILHDDLVRSIHVANAIVDETESNTSKYQLLTEEWLREAFDSCDERLHVWLKAWRSLQREGERVLSVDIRKEAGLPPAR